MLANQQTARPRPPAQARRSTSATFNNGVGASPPPPYVTSTCAFPSKDEPDSPKSPTDLSWLNGKSREELSELLMKADGLIKDRENEMGLTSAAFKSLYDNNAALKSQHLALLSRIPGASPSPSPSPSAASTPLHYSASLPRSHSDSFTSSTEPPRSSALTNKRHTRKISVTQKDISLLADQNAELLQKLEKIETESFNADQNARRALKRFDKEIALLRDELDRSQARSAELEQRVSINQQDSLLKRVEREARIKAVRGCSSADNTVQHEVKDFAPGGALSASPGRSSSQLTSSLSLDSALDRSRLTSVEEASESASPSPSASHSSSLDDAMDGNEDVFGQPETPFQGETTLIAQLMIKIRELEEANTRILAQQDETAKRLQVVQEETVNMSKVYECLNDKSGVFELEVLDEGQLSRPTTPVKKDGDRTSPPAPSTIRFRSFRRTLESDLSKIAESFAASAAEDSNIIPPIFNSSFQKPRKTVMEIFNLPSAHNAGKSDYDHSSGPPVPFPSTPDGMPGEDRPNLSSPALSILSLNTNLDSSTPNYRVNESQYFPEAPSPFDSNTPIRQTLDNELGGEGGFWGLGMGNNQHHLRTTSLLSISSQLSNISVPPSPSPLPDSSTHSNQTMSSIGKASGSGLLMAVEDNTTPPSRPTNPVRLALEPPTPEQGNMQVGSIPVTPENRGKVGQTLRYRRMSQTVRNRTGKWANGRFDSSLSSLFTPGPSEKDEDDKILVLQSTPVAPAENVEPASALKPKKSMSLLVDAVDSVIEKFADSTGLKEATGSASNLPLSPSASSGDNRSMERYQAQVPRTKQQAFVKLVIEMWLWMQFLIILVVFMLAMAKRGPKSVLRDANRTKRVGSA